MNLARFSVNRPVASGIVSVALFLLGLFAVSRMPVSLYPEVSFPFVRILLPYPGASPEQVEATLIKPLEAELSGLKKLKRVIGFARPNGAQVILGFAMSADEREAVDAVREKVAVVRGKFPQGVKEPVVSRVDVGATPVLIFGVETKETPEATRKLLDESLIRTLRRTEGVNEATLLGLGESRVQLELDAVKLAGLRVAPLDIYEQLSAKMAVIPWGDVTQEDKVISVARGILPDDLRYWENELVTLRDGRGLRLGEVGTLKLIRDEDATSVFINGKRGLGLVITKRSDANTVEVVKKVNEVIASFAFPAGMKLFPIVDQSAYVQENAHEVWIALFVGGAFAILVILLFLTDVKSALISATALPVSIAGSFIFMNALGFSLNMMSLLALSLAIGLLIDDAVVVREAIYTEMEHGMDGREAAVKGTDRVAAAVMATTLAVIAVFLPVGAMDGLVGQFFKQFGLTICISVAISTWVAFTLDPMLSAKFSQAPKPLSGRFWDAWRAFLARTERGIARAASVSFKHYAVVLVLAVASLGATGVLCLSRGADFLAFEDRGQFIVNLRGRVGTTREANERTVQDAMRRLQGLDGLKDIYATSGESNDLTLAQIRLVFVPKTKRETGLLALQKQARERLKGLEADFLVMDPPPIEGIGGEAPLSVFVYGEDLQKLRPVAERVRDTIAAIPGVANVRLETAPFGDGLDVTLRTQDMGFAGTQPQAVELTGRLALTGLEAGAVGADNTPFYVRLQRSDRNAEALWDNLLVPTLRGPLFLSQFTQAQRTVRPTAIDRERRSRKMVIWGSLDRTRTYGLVLADVQKAVDAIEPPFSGEISGDKEVFEEMVSSFTLAIVGSLFFIFVILAAQFENLLRPFVILLSLPLAMIGGFLALYVAGEQLAMGALIGLVLLIGLAAKNGILLVDAIGVKEKDMPLGAAVESSVLERSRAILMTSIAMIFGMIPTAVMRGGGSEFRSPMALSIIGGVVSSTLLSFLVVPAVFGLIDAWRGYRAKKRPPAAHAPANSMGALALLASLPLASHWGASEAQADVADRPGLAAPTSMQAPVPTSVPSLPSVTSPGPTRESPGAADLTLREADMSAVAALVGTVRADSAERASIAAAEIAAEGSARSARLAFFGGARVEAGREWSDPGIVQSFTLPFPPRPVTVSTTVLPKAQNVLTLGWQLPIINMQAFYGLELKDALGRQAPLVRDAKLESATLANARALLQTELALQTVRLNEAYLRIARARERTIQERKAAGLATRLDESQATAQAQSAIVQLEQSQTEFERVKAVFETVTGRPYPVAGTGLTSFPFATDAPFSSTAVRALEAVVEVQRTTTKLEDAAFFPGLSLELGYSEKDYVDAPEGQLFAAIRARWDFLDGGVRVRKVTQSRQAEQDLVAQMRGLETDLRGSHASLAARQRGLEKALEAARESRRAAARAQEATLDALRAGLAKITDVRTADENKLRADYGALQLEFALQALAIESLALGGRWTETLAAMGEGAVRR